MAAIGQVYKWVDSSGTAITHIGNGVGGAATQRIAATAGPYTFTASSVTDTNGAPWNVSTCVAGDLVITSDGFVGVYVSQGGSTAVANVDRWINIKTGAIGTPNGSTARILTGTTCLWSPGKSIVLRRLVIKNTAAGTHTIYVGDLALEAYVVTTAGISADIALDFQLCGPVALGSSAGAAYLQFEISPP